MKSPDDPFELIDSTLTTLVEDDRTRARYSQLADRLPARTQEDLNAILESDSLSYRDGVLVQLAYGLCGYEDLTHRHRGGRGVAGRVGDLLAELHISGVKDAFQNIGKNSPNLARGNFPEWDRFLNNASATEAGDHPDWLEPAFKYACAHVAELARPTKPFPGVELSRLTFAKTFALFDTLLSRGSEGAYEQFSVAALLHATVDQYGGDAYRVDTKDLHASDASSRAAGDVQVLIGKRVVEAYEVTANPWQQKLTGAEQTLREYDLSRIHIVAQVGGMDDVVEQLDNQRQDIAVLPLESFIAVSTSALTRQFRAVALERMYELLDRYQPDVHKVNSYVELLVEQGLAVEG